MPQPDELLSSWLHRLAYANGVAPRAFAKQLGVATAILDGEAVVLDEQGRANFGMLQQSLGGRGGKRTSGEAIFMAFDILYFDGHDLRQLGLSSRRHLLEGLVTDREGFIRLSEEIEADGDQLLALACDHDLEGIIAKDRDSTYRSGRLGDWVKIKCLQSDSFVIVGYPRSRVLASARCCLLHARATAWSMSETSVPASRKARRGSCAA